MRDVADLPPDLIRAPRIGFAWPDRPELHVAGLYLAREHLHELARLLEFMLGDHRKEWLAERLDELDAGDIGTITAAAPAFPLAGAKEKARDKALGHVEINAQRMRY